MKVRNERDHEQGRSSSKPVAVSEVWNLPNILTYGRIVAVPAGRGPA